MKSYTVKTPDGRHSFVLIAKDKDDAIVKAQDAIEATKHVNPNLSENIKKELVAEETNKRG